MIFFKYDVNYNCNIYVIQTQYFFLKAFFLFTCDVLKKFKKYKNETLETIMQANVKPLFNSDFMTKLICYIYFSFSIYHYSLVKEISVITSIDCYVRLILIKFRSVTMTIDHKIIFSSILLHN